MVVKTYICIRHGLEKTRTVVRRQLIPYPPPLAYNTLVSDNVPLVGRGVVYLGDLTSYAGRNFNAHTTCTGTWHNKSGRFSA